jgi:Flp pilus assembly pilin Flp
MRLFRNFRKEQRGVAAVEFAIIAPVFLILIFGIIEVSSILYVTMVLEGATTTSSRLAKTGYQAQGATRQDMIYDMIKQNAGLLVDTKKISIASLSYGSFSNIGQPEPFTDLNSNGIWNFNEPYSDVNGNGKWDSDMGITGLGGANDIVLYKITYPWPVYTPLLSKFMGNNGIYTITTNVIVKNEPYNVVQIGG